MQIVKSSLRVCFGIFLWSNVIQYHFIVLLTLLCSQFFVFGVLSGQWIHIKHYWVWDILIIKVYVLLYWDNNKITKKQFWFCRSYWVQGKVVVEVWEIWGPFSQTKYLLATNEGWKPKPRLLLTTVTPSFITHVTVTLGLHLASLSSHSALCQETTRPHRCSVLNASQNTTTVGPPLNNTSAGELRSGIVAILCNLSVMSRCTRLNACSFLLLFNIPT